MRQVRGSLLDSNKMNEKQEKLKLIREIHNSIDQCRDEIKDCKKVYDKFYDKFDQELEDLLHRVKNGAVKNNIEDDDPRLLNLMGILVSLCKIHISLS